MSDLKQAAQQALEALEAGAESWRLIGPAIDALRAALEQPEQEPDRWGAGYEAGYAAGMAEMKPEQAEPVLWIESDDRNFKPLYTHPPRREWQSLSEEEILPLYSMLPSSHAEMLEFARAIEAKLKELNHD